MPPPEPTSRLARLAVDLTPLRTVPAYRRLYLGSAVSAMGSSLTTFAIGLQVYRLTGSSAAVGLVSLAYLVPLVVVGIGGSSVADAVDRRTLVLTTTTVSAAVSTTLALQAFLGSQLLWPLYVLTTVSGAAGALDSPTRRTFTPRLLPAPLRPAAYALDQVSMHLSLTLGPLAAGLLTAAGGLRLCYLLDAVSFLAVLYGVRRLPSMRPDGRGLRPGWRATLDGLRYVRGQPLVLGVLLADLNATVFGMPRSLYPAVNAARFGGHAATLGLITAAMSIGGLLGSALSGPTSRVGRRGAAMLAAGAVWGLAVVGFGLASSLWLTLLTLATAGLADTTSVILRATIVQDVVPDRLRGRVTGVDFVVGAGGPQLGNVEAGVVASLTTVDVSAVSGGVATVVGTGLIALALPALIHYQRGAPD